MNNQAFSYVFWGTEKFAKDILEILIKNNLRPLAVVTAPDKAVGRKQIIQAPPVKELALKENIPVWQITDLKSSEAENFYDELRALNADFQIVAQYGQIIPTRFLESARFGAVNVHGSLLPKYRGASPVQAALLNNDKETGVSLILMDEKMDHGDILATQSIKIEISDNTTSLLDKLAIIGGYLLIKTLPDFAAGELEAIPQNHQEATFCGLIKKEDGLIDWQKLSGQEIFNRFRAYYPWPGIYCFMDNKRLLLLDLDLNEKISDFTPGQFYTKNGKLLISGNDGQTLEIKKLQWEGKNPVSAEEFMRGYKNVLNSD
ncbi:MAG TPA: methionyl-tRNA formyltransferase [bacterium]|nr:methionyl-tRNA formyltransferase [bacterium]